LQPHRTEPLGYYGLTLLDNLTVAVEHREV